MTELNSLIITAVSLGVIHTILGPDHYLPFVAIARARNWTQAKTLFITILCGIGHVASSVILGLVGAFIGTAVSKLEMLESVRGDIAAWFMIAFGMVYLIWGIKRAIRNAHPHMHPEGERQNITPWVLFIIFVLGPCEPLIPVLMYPALQNSFSGMLLVGAVFSLATISTMTLMVYLLNKGISFIRLGSLERYAHALAGFVIFSCGVAIRLGL